MMSAALSDRLNRLLDRHEELMALLADAEVARDAEQFRRYLREQQELDEVVTAWRQVAALRQQVAEAQELLADPEFRELARQDVLSLEAQIAAEEAQLPRLLIPKDPHDESDCWLEIRAGTGGDEAALFAADLFRMYARFAERCGWQLTVTSDMPSDLGGFKEIIARISGTRVYGCLKFESGAHRVQRVPATESQGRIHTSACTVAVMPVVDAAEAVLLNPADLRIDTYRASGAGGQHINKTDSAVRVTHLPTGVVVACQDERSQHKNKARALSLLAAKLSAAQQQQQASSTAALRRQLVGSGDRSERIRTYNYPQGRLTDHRINLTLYRLDECLNGDLDELVSALTSEHQADLLAALSETSS